MNKTILKAKASLINQKAKFECTAPGKPPIIVDYVPPLGDGEGYTSLELLMLSLATCVGSTVKFVVEGKLKKKIVSLEVSAEGIRRVDHPTKFEWIKLNFQINCPGLNREQFDEVIHSAEKEYAPVWSMVKGNCDVKIDCQLLK